MTNDTPMTRNMSRRRFIRTVWGAFQSALLAGMLPEAEAAGKPEAEGTAYRPLNGRSLEEIARRKLHHGGNGRFLNPMGDLRRKRGFGKVLYWKLFHENRFAEDLPKQPEITVQIDWKAIENHRGLSLTLVKHACLLIKDWGRTIMVDPVLGTILPFLRDYSPLAFSPDRIPAPDHILVTHGHYDHLDKSSLSAFPPSTHIVSPLGYGGIFDGLGMKRRTHLDWFEVFSDEGRKITFVPANHWTMRSPFEGPNTALWGGYVIETKTGPTIYLSGDTAYFDGFSQIGDRFDIDVAVFCLGAYEPRWFMAPSHANPDEVVRAFDELGARHLAISHWGTFRLGDEPVHFPPLDLEQALARAHRTDRWIRIEHGQTAYL